MSKVIKLNRNVNLTWEEILNQFILLKQAQGLSETTINDYKYHVKAFFKRYPECWSESVRDCVLQYMTDNIKPATFNIRLVYLKTFFQFCVSEGHLIENPLHDLKRRKAQGRIVDIAEDTLEQLLNLPDQNTFAGLRDFGLFCLTLDTGIRPKEAFSLKEHHLDFKYLQITIPAENAKTRKERVLPISPITAEAIQRIIQSRHPSWKKNIPVFCTFEGKSLNRHTWSDRLEYYSEKIGVKIRPYDLRHSFAVLYLRKGGHAFSLQNTLGHEDISMTKRYVHLSGQDLRDIHKTASPLNSLLPQRGKRVKKIAEKG